MDKKIEKWRAEIDAIDDQLLRLLNKRARLATEIGQVKKREHAPLLDLDREREVLARVCQSTNGPLKEEGIRTIFKTIIDESRRIQFVENVPTTPSQIATQKWDRVTIVGCGLIGASFALALKQTGMCRRIAGWDIAGGVNDEALRRGMIDEVDTSFSDGAVSQSDLIYLAMPVSGIIEFLRERGSQISKSALVTDAGSTKVEICRAARDRLPAGVTFIGGHPIAGSQHSGLQHADAALFTDAPYVLVSQDVESDRVRLLTDTLNAISTSVRFMTAEEHDRALALVSHLPQLLSSTLAAVINGERDADLLLDLAGNGWRDMTRLAGSSWSMWRDILETNNAEITAVLDAFAQRLAIIRGELRGFAEGKRAEMFATSKLFTEANRLAGKPV